jgi:putative DNA primase/helicase
MDQNPYLLPCKTGVINLKTGELESGRQTDFLMKASSVKWAGLDAPCPIFEQTILEIMNQDKDLVDFLQRLLGMALIGEVLQAVIAVWTGAGRNGKSLLDRIMNEVMGPLAGPVRSEMLLDQMRTASSSGPTPDIMALRGIRMAFASETDNGCKISPSRVKWLTGNDRLTGRNPHDTYPTEFDPTHTLFLLTNYKPHAPADDFAFWERVILIPFELSFVNREPKGENERKADPYLIEKIRKEYPGVLAWLVRGCILYQSRGLDIPGRVKDATGEYQRDEDNLADFIEECCYVDPAVDGNAKDLYEEFERWWSTNISKRVPAQKWFGKMLGKKFERFKQGVVKYRGICLPGDMEG